MAAAAALVGAVAVALTSQFELKHIELPLLAPEPTMPVFCAAPLA